MLLVVQSWPNIDRWCSLNRDSRKICDQVPYKTHFCAAFGDVCPVIHTRYLIVSLIPLVLPYGRWTEKVRFSIHQFQIADGSVLCASSSLSTCSLLAKFATLKLWEPPLSNKFLVKERKK